jgi:diguanylate cyclase (GGDEF)-like protein
MAAAGVLRKCRRHTQAAFLSLFPLLLWPLYASSQQAALTTAAQVHDLPADLAAKHLPVHLIATVTYYEPSESTLFIADASGAVYVKTNHPYPIHRGDLIKIDGTTAKSYRTTVAMNPNIQVIGKGSFTRAKIRTYRSYQELMAGKWDCQYVAMDGIVRGAVIEKHNGSKVLELEVMMPGGLVQTYVQDMKGVDPDKLIDAEIELSGVVGGDFNAQWQLMRSVIYAAGIEDLHIIREPHVEPSSLPLTDIDHVMQTHSVDDHSQRVRVRGVLTFYRPGYSAVVQHDGRSLYATTREAASLPLGSLVDLVGFAEDGGYGPSLGQAQILPTGKIEAIQPIPVSYAQAMTGAYSDNLVAVGGTIMSQIHTEAADTLLLMVDNHAITAVLQAHEGIRPLPVLPVGAVVSIRGICRVTPAAVWGGPGMSPMLFRIDMRSRDDLQVLSSPSWWTVAHLLFVVCALMGISFLITAWAVILRRRVAHQTATIERTMSLEKTRSHVLEEINSNVPLEQMLKGICSSVEALAPGLRCCCSLNDQVSAAGETECASCIGEPLAKALFSSPLTDSKGRQVGTFMAGGPGRRSLSHYETEVMTVATGLANLAINQRRMYQELNYTSTHDQLTSLPNRRLSDLNLESALEEAMRTGKRVGVAYIDVDRFKQVNDQHGHKIGDLYLQQIAARLLSRVRTTDKLARIGGDEFLLIASELNGIEDAEAYRRRLEACFEHSFTLDGARVSGSASIGIAVYPDHGATAEDLKRHADIDMYSAKHRRRADYENGSHVLEETSIFSPADLQAALENDQFRLFYQPQFSEKGELRGFEALLRLEDPILGIVTPDAFIAVAERHDVILPLGAWVLRKALADAARWRLDEMEDVRMVVNVASRQIEHPGFADEVVAALQMAGMPPCCLEVEITERTLVRDMVQVIQQLNRLHAEGVRISIDDFGTEHSSLSLLHRLPVDTLKIDRSFVRVLHTEPKVMHVIKAIVSMGNAMQKRIVAEGVETELDVETLLKLGNMDLQGFFFSRPQSFEDISTRLQTWRAGIAVNGQPHSPQNADASQDGKALARRIWQRN